MRKIIYTANIGNYDKNVWLKGKTFKGWDVKVIEEPGTVLDARGHKIVPEFWDDYDLSIWIDANIELKCHPDWLLDYLEKDKYDFAFVEHGRNCVKDEAKACIERKKDDPERIKNQINYYELMGFKDNMLVATGIMVRVHNKKIFDIMCAWFAQVGFFSIRDQLGFPYAVEQFAHKYDIPINLIPYKYYENGTFIIHRHR